MGDQRTVSIERRSRFARNTDIVRKNLDLYLLLIPGLVYVVIFRLIPIWGLSISFQDYNIFAGTSGSEWVGFENYRRLFSSPEFYQVFRNTLIISFAKITLVTPLPIIVAIILNEITTLGLKKTIQTVIYLPHFLSWVIVAGLFGTALSVSGPVNALIEQLGGDRIVFLVNPRFFRSILVASHAWKEVGWAAIVYIAAITSLDPQMFEAATIDGASRLRQVFAITIPGIAPTIAIMFIIRLGRILEAGREQVLSMYNPAVYEVGDIIETFVFRVGLGRMDYSFATAVGMFNSVVAFVLVMSANVAGRRLFGRSIY